MPWRLFAACCLLVTGLALPWATPTQAQPPAGFTDSAIPGLSNINQPTAFAFLPNGDLLVASKPGQLLLYEQAQEAVRATPVFDGVQDICDTSERGLLGVAVDPSFATNRRIYVYYTFDKFNTKQTPAPDCDFRTALDPVNRVSRLTLTPALTVADETVLIDNIPSPNGNHNAGDVQFGKDGLLYVSVGDGGVNSTARTRHEFSGSILRITTEGGIPPGNPWTGQGTARCYDPAPGGNKTGSIAVGQICQELYAYGLRNPFRIAFDPNAAGTRFFINDVGENNAEEIDEGVAGADYGWNCYEGSLSRPQVCNPLPQGTTGPFFEYQRPNGQTPIFNGCTSITAGAFVPNGVWPSSYDGDYVFGDFQCGDIFILSVDGGVKTPGLFLGGKVVTHMTFGPLGGTQALYYADFYGGTIRTVTYSGGANRPPIAALTAAPRSGAAPLTVNFSGAGSADPDSDQIAAYLWAFGDGSTSETATATTSHTYAGEGAYTATLRVRDSRGALSTLVSLRIDVGNTPPTPVISLPPAGATFSVGQQITLSGSATDPQDGALPASALSWEVRRHHAEHFHPYHSATGASTSLSAPAPEDFDAIDNSYLEVRLSATDSNGLTAVVTRELRPNIVTLTALTEPPGLQIIVDDSVDPRTLADQSTLRVWAGQTLSLSAPAGQSVGAVTMQLCGWRHGGPPEQQYSVPSLATSLRAVFKPVGVPCPDLSADLRLFLPLVGR